MDNENVTTEYDVNLTPEAIEAGVQAYCNWRRTGGEDDGTAGELAKNVFRAMLPLWRSAPAQAERET
jgi:hypothetical protein